MRHTLKILLQSGLSIVLTSSNRRFPITASLVKRAVVLSYKTHALIILYTVIACNDNSIIAQPVISNDDDPPCFEIEARVRNGNTGFEGALFSPSTPPPGQPGGGQWQMNPSGAPIWNTNGNTYSDVHSFLFTYTKATGTSIWQIDFNRDGDYIDPQESVTNVAPALIGKGFKYINVWGQGHSTGLTASLSDFTINGVDFGSFSSSSETPFSTLFENMSGLFDDIAISGNFSFSGDGGQERPRIWVRLGTANEAPLCVLTNPLTGTFFNVLDDILIEADASDDGIITVVEFYAGATKIGEDSISPYSFTWIGGSPGLYTLTAKAIDSYDAYTITAPVSIIINAPPTCSITHPLSGFVYFEPDSIVIDAVATDMDDSVAIVEFYLDTVKIGEDSLSPYQMVLYNPPSGLYFFTAKATDSRNGMTISSPVAGIVNAPPTCMITAPANGSLLYDPNTITVEVLANDATDSVVLVEFFFDSLFIGSDNVAPFENNTLINTPMGIYTLYAQSTDIFGIVTISSIVNITVRCVREDLDNNGTVNTSDFIQFLTAFGTICSGCSEDFNDDGAVNSFDFLLLLSKLGYSCN